MYRGALELMVLKRMGGGYRGLTPDGNYTPHSHWPSPPPWWDGEENQKKR